jgi:hypothetical protein
MPGPAIEETTGGSGKLHNKELILFARIPLG